MNQPHPAEFATVPDSPVDVELSSKAASAAMKKAFEALIQKPRIHYAVRDILVKQRGQKVDIRVLFNGCIAPGGKPVKEITFRLERDLAERLRVGLNGLWKEK